MSLRPRRLQSLFRPPTKLIERKSLDKLFNIVLFVAIIVFAPFIAVWCMNTLFFSGPLVAYAIPYSISTWLASLLFFGGILSSKRSK